MSVILYIWSINPSVRRFDNKVLSAVLFFRKTSICEKERIKKMSYKHDITNYVMHYMNIQRGHVCLELMYYTTHGHVCCVQ